MNPSLTLFNAKEAAPVNPVFETEVWANDCRFTEGPVWHPDGYYLFSDIPANCIYRISTEGGKEVFLEPSGCTCSDRSFLSDQPGSNGLAFDRQGRLYICQHGNGAVAQWSGGTIESFLTGPDDRPFNSPNDIVVDSTGAVFFSDPPYGLKDQQLNPALRQAGAAVYCWRDGLLNAFCREFRYPNGVCLSPDERTLYVGSSKPFERKLLAYDAVTLQVQRQLADENCDGLKCDPEGRLWLCMKEGLLVIGTDGRRIALIRLPEEPANCCWGGRDGRDLLVTARNYVFLLRELLR